MYLGQEIKQILPGNVAIGGENMGMVPLFSVQWCPSRAGIWAGYAPLDGQEVSQNLYPDAFAGIGAGNVPTTSEATWQADPTARGAYVEESSPGFFRLPDMNGKSAGSLGAVFLRGDGTLSAAVSGVIQQDAFQAHSFASSQAFSITDGTGADATGVPYYNRGGGTTPTGGNWDATASNPDSHKLSSAFLIEEDGGIPRTASETRPLNVTGCWVVKLFGAVTNVGSADAAQLASDYAQVKSDYANANSRISVLESVPGIGYNQTWQDVRADRAGGVTYTNTTGRTITVLAAHGAINTARTLTIDGNTITWNNSGGTTLVNTAICVPIPPGSTYEFNGLPAKWLELR